QHILLTRAPALTGRYEFLSFRNAAGGRAWLSAILEKVHSAKAMREAVNEDKRWVSVAFTWNGLRGLGVDEASLATFPEEFRQGWPPGRRFSGTPAPTIQTTGWTIWRIQTFMASLFCSPEMLRNAIAVCGSISNMLRGFRRCKRSRRWTWRQRRHWSTHTTTSAIVIAYRSRSSTELARCRHPVPVHLSRQVNFSLDTPTRRALPKRSNPRY